MVGIFELFVLLAFALVGVGSVVVIFLVLRTWLKLSADKGKSTGLRAKPSSLHDPAVDWVTTQNLAASHVSDPTPYASQRVGADSSGSYNPGGTSTAPDHTSTGNAPHVSTDLWGDFGGGNAGGGGAGGSWTDAGGGGDLGGGAGGDPGGST